MTWRELLCVTARYYKAGEHPWPDWRDAAEFIAEHVTVETEDVPDDWWAQHDLWWFPSVGEDRKVEGGLWPCRHEIPDLDASYRLMTDAVHFERIVPGRIHRGNDNDYPGGLIQYEIEQVCVRDALIGCADDLKTFCDQVRGSIDAPWIEALIVFECDAGRDYWGEYFSDYQPIGLLDLSKAEVEGAAS